MLQELLFCLLKNEKAFPKEDSDVTGVIYTVSVLIPCTFIKATSFAITSKAIIDSSFILQFANSQDDLVILEEESHHPILTILKDKGPLTLKLEAIIESEEKPQEKSVNIPILNKRQQRNIKQPSKLKNYPKWD